MKKVLFLIWVFFMCSVQVFADDFFVNKNGGMKSMSI